MRSAPASELSAYRGRSEVIARRSKRRFLTRSSPSAECVGRVSFPRIKSLVACLVRQQSIEHHRHLPAPIGQKRQTREERMKAALRLLLVTSTLVLAGHVFAEVLPTAEPVTVDVSPG